MKALSIEEAQTYRELNAHYQAKTKRLSANTPRTTPNTEGPALTPATTESAPASKKEALPDVSEDGLTAPPPSNSPPGFGMQPMNPDEIRKLVKVDPEVKLTRDRSAASDAISQPHQGREPINRYTRNMFT